MKTHRCPKCGGSRLFLDIDYRARADRKYCPLCGYSEWFGFATRNPYGLETNQRTALVWSGGRPKSTAINGVAVR